MICARLFSRGIITSGITVPPVSYTHLDVYKRQPRGFCMRKGTLFSGRPVRLPRLVPVLGEDEPAERERRAQPHDRRHALVQDERRADDRDDGRGVDIGCLLYTSRCV